MGMGRNQKIKKVIIILVAVLAMVVGLSGCRRAPAPEVLPYDYEILEIPREAYLGDYITVKVKVSDRNTAYELWLYRSDAKDEWDLEYSFGYTIPDDQGVVCWYVKLDEHKLDRRNEVYLTPGAYFIYVYQTNINDNLFLRNIIIKE